jgi:hypothetical protein
LTLVAWGSVAVPMYAQMMERMPLDPTPDDVSRVQQEMMEEMMARGGLPMSTLGKASAFGGAFAGLAGVFLGIASLVRQERRKIMAILACLFAVMFSCCSGVMLPHALLPTPAGRAVDEGSGDDAPSETPPESPADNENAA